MAVISAWAVAEEPRHASTGSGTPSPFSVKKSDSGDGIDPTFLASMFDLTPAEAGVAVALQSGVKLRAIASSRQVSVETVRSQLKSIYAKTDTRGQAELVRLLFRLGQP